MEKEIEQKKPEATHKKSKFKETAKKISGNYWAVASIVLAVILIINLSSSSTNYPTANPNDVGKKVLDFANSQGAGATLNGVEKEGQFYKVTLKIKGQDVPVYVTMDGKNLVPSLIPLEIKQNQQNNPQQKTPEVKKSDKPDVELYVMSMCPYGTQMEKGILPVLDTLKDKINFKLKFVNYAMHGKDEVDENTLQYCVQKEAPEKLTKYLKCYLEKRDPSHWKSCITSSGIDKSKIDSCISETDKKYNITNLYNDKSTWRGGRFPFFPIDDADNKKYGVGGSPTLVINGAQVRSARDSASLLNTICSAFNTKPSECNTQLSSQSPSPGFGYSASGGSSGNEGGCGA